MSKEESNVKSFEIIAGPPVQDIEDINLFGLSTAKTSCENCPAAKHLWFPFSRHLEKGKTYDYCGCGRSTNFPFCDHSSHTVEDVKSGNGPVRFKIIQDQTSHLICGCRFSSAKPFCDGSHATPSKFLKPNKL